MAPNRITRGAAVRRALFLAMASALAAVALGACGGGGGTTTVVPDPEADAEILGGILGRQIAAVGAYDRSLPALRGSALASAREFRAQEQEHVDAVVKALRGLGAPAEPEEEEIEASGLRTEADFLGFLYELESASIELDLSAVSHLTASWPRSLLAAIAANQAQHLVVLRRELGAAQGELVPEAFEEGATPAPATPPNGGS